MKRRMRSMPGRILFALLFLIGTGCGGPPTPNRTVGASTARGVPQSDTDGWRPPASWAREPEGPIDPEQWRTPEPEALPEGIAAVVRVDLTDPDALATHNFVEQFGRASSSQEEGHQRLEVQSHGGWTRDYGHYDTQAWWWNLDHRRGWAVEARLRVARASDPEDVHCGASLVVTDTRGGTEFMVSPAGVGVTHPTQEVHPVADIDGFHTYRFERSRASVRVFVDGELLFESDALELDQRGGLTGRRLWFGQPGGCQGGSTTDWAYVQYEVAPALASPCPSCAEGEHPRLAVFRRAVQSAEPVDGTAAGSLGCMARAAFDETAHTVLPAMLRQAGHPARAGYIAALPSLRTRADADARYDFVRAVLVDVAGPSPTPPVARKRGRKQTPPHGPPQPVVWNDWAWRAAYDALSSGADEEALWQLQSILSLMLRDGYALSDEIDSVVRAAADAARGSGC